ncbi:putative DNA polymerase delta subunit 2 [Trypanosoma grayi]|uniref:putative DNA polymerase delta subunit 2 n=1 Tax=Trypanosoma grayi TaxID=71804 RepID=UPI0004F42E63|nr:putative DNA polymerase delta subunit 2 [Trypanosoma grayi]KEG12062.1 putative DNA polymerase delta subunit 2 [Trypanosoma grayi]
MTSVSRGEEDKAPQQRAALPIERTHQRFLLRQLQFTQQYAAMYRCRMEALQPRALRAVRARVTASTAGNQNGATANDSAPPFSRVLELAPGQRALCVGVLYKHMRLLPRFLDEYQKELVRIDAGEDDEDDQVGGVASIACDAPLSVGDGDAFTSNEEGGEGGGGGGGESRQQPNTLCTAGDELFLEDISGRVRLEGVPANLFCTGIVLGVEGSLRENGVLAVHRYAMTDAREMYVPRTLRSVSRLPPCYVAVVCGLALGCPQQEQQDPDVARGRTMAELLVDYLSGNVGDAAVTAQAARIARLVIAGNSIAPTDELRLKKKVKLDPSDHVRLGDDRQGDGVVTSAMLMRELDAVLARMADTIEIDLMPGDQDMSNAFQPQQPLHPLLLPESSRRSSLKLVTNPHEFSVFPGDADDNGISNDNGKPPGTSGVSKTREGGTTFFVSSGNGLNDVIRETRYSNRLDALSMLLHCGCACPTAPNTLFSYPFKETDPFVFTRTPHCCIYCDQPEMQSRWEPLAPFVPTSDGAADEEEELSAAAAAAKDGAGVRLICVPPFAKTGVLVLVDVNSPQLDTTVVKFVSASHTVV